MEAAPINLKAFLQSDAVTDRGIGAWQVPGYLYSLEFHAHFFFSTVGPVDRQQTQIHYQMSGCGPTEEEAIQRRQRPIGILTN